MSIRHYTPRRRARGGASPLLIKIMGVALGATILMQIAYPLVDGDVLPFKDVSTWRIRQDFHCAISARSGLVSGPIEAQHDCVGKKKPASERGRLCYKPLRPFYGEGGT